MINHTHFFLAQCTGWAHTDRSAQVRVHLALTSPDAEGNFYAVRGTTRHEGRVKGQAVRVNRSTANGLKLDTTFVTTRDGIVQLNKDDVIRVVGQVEERHFNTIWDQIQGG